jgi:hypothetical protein
MTVEYVFLACNDRCILSARHKCEMYYTCSAIPTCILVDAEARILCYECNRHLRNLACSENHRYLKILNKTFCDG